MTRLRRAALALVAAITIAVTASACTPAASESIDVGSETTIVDVRTPAEYADGHLDGAVNIDVSDPGFDALVQALDPDAAYVVYCRSGNRSAQAAARMEALGFTDVTDAGSLDAAASATGLAIVLP
jgi:phage shock protein E